MSVHRSPVGRLMLIPIIECRETTQSGKNSSRRKKAFTRGCGPGIALIYTHIVCEKNCGK